MLEAVNEQTLWDVIALYLELGFIHILPRGLDHILFVIALFLTSARIRDLIWQISAFTLAHTITLGLATTGHVSLPGSIVEPLIALTIAFVAIENLIFKDMPRWRPAMIFAFGLIHGLGFAGVLGELGLAEQNFIASLISFNIGVELGQLAIIAAFIILRLGYHRLGLDDAVGRAGSVLIGLAGIWWAVERVFL